MPKKPTNPNTWQGAILDSVEEVRLLVEQLAAGGTPGPPQTDWTSGTCAGCVHFNEVVAATSGECRRFPPAIMDIDAEGTTGSLPPGVLATFSCSEWRAV